MIYRVSTDKQDAEARRINELYTGSIDNGRPRKMHEVEQKTGIKPPAWFNADGVTLGQVGVLGPARRVK